MIMECITDDYARSSLDSKDNPENQEINRNDAKWAGKTRNSAEDSRSKHLKYIWVVEKIKHSKIFKSNRYN